MGKELTGKAVGELDHSERGWQLAWWGRGLAGPGMQPATASGRGRAHSEWRPEEQQASHRAGALCCARRTRLCRLPAARAQLQHLTASRTVRRRAARPAAIALIPSRRWFRSCPSQPARCSCSAPPPAPPCWTLWSTALRSGTATTVGTSARRRGTLRSRVCPPAVWPPSRVAALPERRLPSCLCMRRPCRTLPTWLLHPACRAACSPPPRVRVCALRRRAHHQRGRHHRGERHRSAHLGQANGEGHVQQQGRGAEQRGAQGRVLQKLHPPLAAWSFAAATGTRDERLAGVVGSASLHPRLLPAQLGTSPPCSTHVVFVPSLPCPSASSLVRHHIPMPGHPRGVPPGRGPPAGR